MAQFPPVSQYITTFDAEGKSVFHEASNATATIDKGPDLRVDHIYWTPGSSTGPPLADDVDLKAYQTDLVSDPPLYVTFGTVGGSAAAILNFAPNPNDEPGFMHRTKTIDYVFVLDGDVELTLDSGEKRILKRGDAVVQRATQHAWKNLSKTEPARLAAATVSIEGAVLNEMIAEGDEK